MTVMERPAVDVQGLDSAYLDCVNDNLAALLRFHGVEDVRTPFACQWDFDFIEEDDGAVPLPTLERRPVAEMIAEQTGFDLVMPDVQPGDETRFCADLTAAGQPVLVEGDAYLMPWLPYYGRQHMNHSFIVEAVGEPDPGLLRIADAYYNKTEWGEAVPIRTVLPVGALRAITESAAELGEAPFLVLERRDGHAGADHRQLLLDNAERIRRQLGERHLIREYSRHAAEQIAGWNGSAAAVQFTLACWLIARSRALHGLWLEDLAGASPALVREEDASAFAEKVVRPWQRVAEFAYVLQRRVHAGREAPRSAFDLIERAAEPAEVALAERLADMPA